MGVPGQLARRRWDGLRQKGLTGGTQATGGHKRPLAISCLFQRWPLPAGPRKSWDVSECYAPAPSRWECRGGQELESPPFPPPGRLKLQMCVLSGSRKPAWTLLNVRTLRLCRIQRCRPPTCWQLCISPVKLPRRHQVAGGGGGCQVCAAFRGPLPAAIACCTAGVGFALMEQ